MKNTTHLVIAPTPKENASVSEVIRIDIAASLIDSPIRFWTGKARLVCRTAATIKNILSVPTATRRNGITPTISLYGTPKIITSNTKMIYFSKLIFY